MKKITLSFIALLSLSLSVNSQTISFEASEGYTLGDINGQKNWEVIQDADGDFIQNQVITDELASDGSYSLKLAQEPDYEGFFDPIIGGFYNYETALHTDEASFSTDVYISSEQGFSGLSFLFGLIDASEERYRTYVNFAYDGYMDALVQSDEPGRIERVDLGVTWEPNTWYNIKIETNGVSVRFYLDGDMIHEGELASTGVIDQVRFVHDNYEGTVYVDNFKTNEEELAIENFDLSSVNHFYDPNSKILTLNSQDESFTSVSIYNVLGQSVLNKKLNDRIEIINMSSFNDGLYIVKMTIGNTTKTIKILKR